MTEASVGTQRSPAGGRRRWWRAAVAAAVVGLAVVAVPAALSGSGPGTAGAGADTPAMAPCPSQAPAGTCVTETVPCGQSTCSVSAGPVTDLADGQSVYVTFAGFPADSVVALAFCSISGGTVPVAVDPDPSCASAEPTTGCLSFQDCGNIATNANSGSPGATSVPYQWEYLAPASGQVGYGSITPEEDPPTTGGTANTPITSESPTQSANSDDPTNGYGGMYCDDGPDFCGVEVMDLSSSFLTGISQGVGTAPGLAPYNHTKDVPFVSTSSNTAIFPVSWTSGGSGCGSAPQVTADTSYSAAQFLPAAGEATCSGPDGVAVDATAIPSVDQLTCQATDGATGQCPVYDVIDGSNPVTFTDDPEDPTTLTEEKQAGGTFAYIPIALSGTVIAIDGDVKDGLADQGYSRVTSYQLTAAMAAGVMTQAWSNGLAPGATGAGDDNLCAQLPAPDDCTEELHKLPGEYHVLSGGVSVEEKLTQFSVTGDYNQPAKTSRGQQVRPAFSPDTAFYLLNPQIASPGLVSDGLASAQQLATFLTTASGANYQATAWMCAAPSTPYAVDDPTSGSPASVVDTFSSAQLLTDAELAPTTETESFTTTTKDGYTTRQPVWTPENSPVAQYWFPSSKCQSESALPADWTQSGNLSSVTYYPEDNPEDAAKYMSNTNSGSEDLTDSAGVAFSAMDSSEADYYGLFTAAVQNAAGQFVLPDQASLDAAVADAAQNADGTIAPDYDDTADPAAYPMPMVTYALVSTAPQPTMAQAQELKDLLTNLVNYSAAGGAGYAVPMPAGYAPLPSSLAAQAKADIAKDIVGPGGTPPPATGGASGATNPGGASSTAAPASTTKPSSNPIVSAVTSASKEVTSVGTAVAHGITSIISTLPGPVKKVAQFVAQPILLLLGADRFLVPGLLALTAVCLVVGPMLYLSPSLRDRVLQRRRREPPSSAGGTSSLPAPLDAR